MELTRLMPYSPNSMNLMPWDARLPSGPWHGTEWAHLYTTNEQPQINAEIGLQRRIVAHERAAFVSLESEFEVR